MQFEIIDKNHHRVICSVIATYHNNDTNKDYIVYTDNKLNEEQKLNVYYSLYEKKNDSIKLIDITTDEDRRIGLELIKDIINKIK